jgi:hypothetical protein
MPVPAITHGSVPMTVDGVPLAMSGAPSGATLLTRYFVQPGVIPLNEDLRVNGASNAVACVLAPDPGQTWVIESVTLSLADDTMTAAGFGALAALTNGVALYLGDSDDPTDPAETAFFGAVSADAQRFLQTNRQAIAKSARLPWNLPIAAVLGWAMHWQTREDFGAPLTLVGGDGRAMYLIVQDNLSAGLELFTCLVRGYAFPTPA